jgi:hypothetical protein
MNSIVWVDITFPIKGKETVKSDIKPELISDFLTEWCMTQIGLGKDTRIRCEADVYHVRISCDFSTDTFKVQSDTGNDSLTLGIVMAVIARQEAEKNEKTNF